jgi:hypothetical protein
MPYADPEKQREAQRRWYLEKYQTDRKFRKAESVRKAGWLQSDEGKESNAAASARYREKVKKLKAKTAKAAKAAKAGKTAKKKTAAKPKKSRG